MKQAERKELILWHKAVSVLWLSMKLNFEADGFFSEWCYVLWRALEGNPYGDSD